MNTNGTTKGNNVNGSNSDGKKIGRNDPCPCGSGKKYKNCCLQREEAEEEWERFRRKMDALYPKIDAVNAPLLGKSNEDNYRTATFTEAMDFTVTSNALSLIKSVHQKSDLSATSALSARNVIEALVIIKMHEDGVFTEEDEKLFLWQYPLIEYDTYLNDGEKLASLLDKDDLTARYECAKKIYNDAGITGGVEGGKLRRAVHSRVPFMYKHTKNGRQINFNQLLRKHMPAMLRHYSELSYYVHPNYNTATKSRGKYISAIKAIICAVEERYCRAEYRKFYEDYALVKNYPLARVPLSVRLTAYCSPDADPANTDVFKVQRLMRLQGNLLIALAKDCENFYRSVFEELADESFMRGNDNYLSRFFGNLPVMLYDLTYDYVLGLKECVKMKFKTVAESFAYFNEVIAQSVNFRAPVYGTTMLRFHELVKALERSGKALPDTISHQTADLIYEAYKENYPKELYPENPFYKAGKEEGKQKFLRLFCKPLGNFLDGKGQIPSYIDLVRDFFAQVYGEEAVLNRAKLRKAGDAQGEEKEEKLVLARDYAEMLYRESNNMSHGCGYLFFVNIGAFADVEPVLQGVDRFLCRAVGKVREEIEQWQKIAGKENHLRVNDFLNTLKKAEGMLNAFALEKSLLYRIIIDKRERA